MSTNKNRLYELIYLVNREASDEARADIVSRMKAVIDSFGGEVMKTESWGKRRLAYEIQKGSERHQKAYYEYNVLQGPAGMTQELERVLRLNEDCIRFLTIKIDSFDPSATSVNTATETAESTEA
jgi:small subunit ribosomal protein S6